MRVLACVFRVLCKIDTLRIFIFYISLPLILAPDYLLVGASVTSTTDGDVTAPNQVKEGP